MSDFKFVISQSSGAHYVWNSKTTTGIRISLYNYRATKSIVIKNWTISKALANFQIRDLTFCDIFDSINKYTDWSEDTEAINTIKPFFKELVDNL